MGHYQGGGPHPHSPRGGPMPPGAYVRYFFRSAADQTAAAAAAVMGTQAQAKDESPDMVTVGV